MPRGERCWSRCCRPWREKTGDREREKVEGGQKVGDEGAQEGRRKKKSGEEGKARRGCGDCSLQMVMK